MGSNMLVVHLMLPVSVQQTSVSCSYRVSLSTLRFS